MTEDPLPASPAPGQLPPERPRSSASPLTWIIALSLAAMVGALLFVGGYLAAGSSPATGCAAPNEAFEAFCEAYDKLQAQYVDELDAEELAEGAIRGMFEYGVADPFSGYMPPESYRSALDDLSGTFSGIGAEMAVDNLANPGNLEGCAQFTQDCALVVVAPLQDSPSAPG
jgi:C-terminal processing protease CtpA/Prc